MNAEIAEAVKRLTSPGLRVVYTGSSDWRLFQLDLQAVLVALAGAEEQSEARRVAEGTGILLEWRCETCNWRDVLPAPGFAGDGYRHFSGGNNVACGPLVARRVGGWARLLPGASREEIAEALESTR